MHRFQQYNIHSIAFSVLLRYTCTQQQYETRLGLYVARKLFPILTKSGVSRQIFESPVTNFTKIRPVGAALTKLIVASCYLCERA